MSSVFCLPGNPGTEKSCINVASDIKDFNSILSAAALVNPDLIIVGPEDPLAEGVSDFLRNSGYCVFGPGKKGAGIESDKSFAKRIMKETGIPTAKWYEVTSEYELEKCLNEMKPPYVVKASGLAQGKGVFICREYSEALSAGKEMISGKILGDAGKKLVVEEFIQGFEVSYFFATDGEKSVCLPPAHDYKKAFDGDNGPNTGGMGSVSPVGSFYEEKAKQSIAEPLLDYLRNSGIEYRGLIFAGAIISQENIYVLEFNCRFGDPETQSSLGIVEEGLFEMLYSCARGSAENSLSVSGKKAVSVVLASRGYPENPETGNKIRGLEDVLPRESSVFFAGVQKRDNGLFTSGGRVFTVRGKGETVADAKNIAYCQAEKIGFDGKWMRNDIGEDVSEYLI